MGRKNRLLQRIILVVALLVVVAVVFLLNRDKNEATTGPTSVPGAAIGKPSPIAQVFNGCPPTGDGGDPALNILKNRVDEAPWQPSTVGTILSYTWPKAIEQQPRSRWSGADAAAISQYEGLPVQVEGYLVDAKKQGPESCNCHSVDDVDFHIWLVDDPGKGRDQSVVVEASPRVRSFHPKWTLTNLRAIINRHQRVRISGWLMMDPEHPDQIGKTRGTIWEIHPIMQIETQSGGGWQPLDDGTTGVKSVGASAPATVPVVAESTVSPPPVSNAKQQRNQDVQITDVHYDGVKGRNEPDEYVAITNQGTQPVDITDWVLQDESGRNEYRWDSYVMQPGQSIRVYTNEVHPDTGGFSFGAGSGVWSNSGDVATLYDADHALVSRFAYGNKNKDWWSHLWDNSDDNDKVEVENMPRSRGKITAKVQAGDQAGGQQQVQGTPATPTPTAAPATIRKGIYLSALIYVEGDQPPAEDFNAFARAALSDRLAWKHDPAHDALAMTLKNVEEKTDVEDNDKGTERDAADKEAKFQF